MRNIHAEMEQWSLNFCQTNLQRLGRPLRPADTTAIDVFVLVTAQAMTQVYGVATPAVITTLVSTILSRVFGLDPYQIAERQAAMAALPDERKYRKLADDVAKSVPNFLYGHFAWQAGGILKKHLDR